MIRTCEFLAVFRDSGEPLHLRAFKPKKAPDTTENRAVLWDTTLAELSSSQELQSELREANKTRGVYFGVNVGGATDDSITRFTAFFAEADNSSISEQHAAFDSAPLKPSIRVETRNSVHGYYLIAGDCGESEWRGVQEGLIAHFDSDPKIKNPSRVMRLPNFDHLLINGTRCERKRITMHTFEPSRRYTVAEMRPAFPAPQRENIPQPFTNGRFEYHEDRHGELCQRIMSRGKRNAKGNWDAKGICHSGKGDKGLVYFPSSAAVKCNAEPACDYFSILRAEGLSDVHLPSKDPNRKSEVAECASAHADDGVIARLAMLAPLDYDRVRESEAKALGCRTSILDKLVDAERPKQHRDLLQGTPLALPEVELWPGAVVGAAVLDEISKAISCYVALPPGAADVIALWCAHAHIYDVFDCSPRLNFSSPEKGCGKTVARDVTALFVPRPLATENLSVAVLFRIVESQRPTLLADECDAYLGNNDELRGMLNAGHRRGGQALRCEGESNKVRAFNVFGPAVLCGIGSLPGTLADRSIKIRLERAKPGEVSKRFDFRRTQHEQELCRKLARFCTDNRAALEASDPTLPASANNRLADNWRPTFAVAEIAGGDWAKRIVRAFATLNSEDDIDSQSLGVMLLADLQKIFATKETDRLFSRTLVEELVKLSDRPWPEAHKQKPITQTWLARHLRDFRILSKSIRIEKDSEKNNAKGYELKDFRDAFDRYLSDQQLSSRHSVTIRTNNDENENVSCHKEKACDVSKTHEAYINTGLCRCDAIIPSKGLLESEEEVIRGEREAIEWEGSQRCHE